MAYFLKKNVTVFVSSSDDLCYSYAVSELIRLLGKAGCRAEKKTAFSSEQWSIGIDADAPLTAEGVRDDGFLFSITETAVSMAAVCPKGILNAVYEFAEMLGFAFLFPGEEGEWQPETVKTPECGTFLRNPRFPRRGLYFSTTDCHSLEEHLRYMAKLKFNSVRYLYDRYEKTPLYRQLGLRREIGEHLLTKFLDRKCFEEKPECFRMFQPSDFGGKRMPDANLCITNPESRRIVGNAFKDFLKMLPEDVEVIHPWADDLPGSGWCMCPSCRSYTACDQNMLCLKLLCRAADAVDSKIRLSVLAYHDTLYPSSQIPLEKRMLLNWAPRERCYAHALNDPSCERNRIHWQAFEQWKKLLEAGNLDDMHTFEYYCDQLLYSGLYPFLPDVIAADAAAYKESGVESFMTLQVSSYGIMPDYNELFFARVNWDPELTARSFAGWISEQIAGDAAEHFCSYLLRQAEYFQKAMLMCGHDLAIYLDYRWLPESVVPFADQAVAAYKESAAKLDDLAGTFKEQLPANAPERFKALAEQEYFRAKFEAAQIRSMYFQQSAMNCFGKAQVYNDEKAAAEGCEFSEQQIKEVERAVDFAHAAGYPDAWHYLSARAPWAIREAKEKISKYADFSAI